MSQEDVTVSRPEHCLPLKMELASSSRSRCRKCGDAIEKGELRLAFEAVNPDSPYPGPVPHWHHTRCVGK